ncbi:hypothetical protein FRX31_007004, partial [Thalictrum thalictroides]
VLCNNCKKPVKASQYASHAGNSISIGGLSVKDGSVLCSGSTDYTAVVNSPSEKRTKLYITSLSDIIVETYNHN